MMRLPVLLALTTAALAACATDGPTGRTVQARELPVPEGTYGTGPTARVRSVASIVPAGDSLLIDVPAQVRRGETLQVALSVGAGGCTRPDTIAVNVSDLTATVVPYVSDPTPESMIMCTADFRVARATAAIVFAQTGEARVRIIYRSSGTTLSTVERRVRVTD